MADNDQIPNVDAFSARMFDHDAGKYVDVPAHQVTDFVKSGRYTFPAGMTLPTINAKGELSDTPSEAAYNDFNHHGVSWATPQLQQGAVQQQNQQIQRDNFADQPITAALAGAVRAGTLGMSDVALSAGGLGDAARGVAQQNPGATFAGELAGTVGMMAGTGGLGGLGEAAAGPLARGLATQGASKLTQTVAPAIVREAAVGSVFGLGSGISEQALGHPDDVVDNIVSHVGMGALFGGAAGSLFGTSAVARPYFDTLVEKATQGGSSLANKAVSSIMSGRVTAALNQAGEEEAAKVAGGLANDPDFVNLWSKNPTAGKQFVQENADITANLKDQISTLEKDLRSGLKDASQQTKETVAQAVSDVGGNIFDANTQTYHRLQQSKQAFDNIAQILTQPLHAESTTAETFNNAVDTLKQSDSALARNVGTKIDNLLKVNPFQTVGDEVGFLNDVRGTLKNLNVESFPGPVKTYISTLIEDADQSLTTHPNPAVSEGYAAIKGLEQASEQMRLVADKTVNRITKATLQGEQTADAGYKGASRVFDDAKIGRTLSDPKTRQTVAAVLENLEQFAPEIKQASLGMKNVEQRIAFQNALETKMSAILPKGRIDGADIVKVLDQLGSPQDLVDKFTKLVDAQKIMQNPSAIDRVIAAKQALGQPVSNDILAVAKYQQQFDFLNKVADVQGNSVNPLRIGRAALKVLHGNVPGALMDIALGVQKTTVRDSFNTIAAVQKASERGAQMVQKSVKTVANALTGSKAQTAVKSIGYAATEGPTLKEQRKAYPQMADMLAKPLGQHPLSAHAPQLAQTFSARQQQVQQYLQQHLPQDPLKENSIIPNKTGYIPSDQDLSSFNRRVQAANNPMQVVHNIAQNKVSPEEMDALKTLNPGIYHQLQTAVINGIVDNKSDLTYQKKIQLGTLFDIPTDYTLRPDFTARMQANLNQDLGGRPEGPSATKSVKIDLKPNTSVATEAQQVTYGLTKGPA